MIIVSGGIKGGSGKSTTAINLAVMAATDGKNVLFVDADDQRSASDFATLRNEEHGNKPSFTTVALSGKDVHTEVVKLVANYDHVIIDTGGRDTSSQRAALVIADILLVPFSPRAADVWTIENVDELMSEVLIINPGLRAYSFINKADPSGALNSEAMEQLRDAEHVELLEQTIGNRKVFGTGFGEGLGVEEMRPKDIKAIREMRDFYTAVFRKGIKKK